MLEKITELIKIEDPKNPQTDEAIAIKLHIAREHVTQIRKEHGIPDSRERRKQCVKETIRQIWRNNGAISERKMTECMKEHGFQIGKYVIGKYMKEMGLVKIDEKEMHVHDVIEEKKESIFQRFIGYNGSMSNQIQRAQAAVLYPPNGIHTLIYGPSGVGKSYLADLMYQYAKTTENFKEDMPFYQFNCADYAENPQLLMAQLFGYCKGAFTGANEAKKGIVEQCDGGILFLDEVHRLPPEGQEILFYLMDKGKYRRLGEVDIQRNCQVMVIAATTENPESSLLLTFRRRIPMDIEIPSISERPWGEKLELIQQNFMRECQRLKRELIVDREVTMTLMELSYPGNVGQLKSDIQVCCAKAFLECKALGQEEIHITKEMKIEFKERGRNRLEKEAIEYCNRDLVFSYNENCMYEEPVYEEQEDNIYQRLEDQYDSMRLKGVKEDAIEEILSEKIEQEFSKYIKQVEKSGYSKEELIGIVGEEIVQLSTEIYEYAKQELPDISDQMVFSLAIHLYMAKQRQPKDIDLKKAQIEKMKQQYRREYVIVKKIIDRISKKYYLEFPEEELLFIAMYLEKFQKKEFEKDIYRDKIAVLVVSHGSVASGMLKVANTVMGVQYGESLDFDLTEKASQMKEAVIKKVRELEKGKGCIVLADMGTLINVAEELEQLPISASVIGRTDTLMVIECIRKVLWTEASMDEIVKELKEQGRGYKEVSCMPKERKKAILCLCITGKGVAEYLKSHLQQRLKSCLHQVEIITRGYIEHDKIENLVEKVEKSYEIIAIVGTMNSKVKDYEFLTYSEVMLPTGIQKLREIIKRKTRFENNILSEVIHKELILHHSEWKQKDEILDEAIGAMVRGGYVEPEFLLSVYKREGMMTTFLKGGIAIPHGAPNLVTKSVISITKLDIPIIWDGMNMVDLIFVIALKEESTKYFEQLYSIIADESLILQIRSSKDSSEILNILCKST